MHYVIFDLEWNQPFDEAAMVRQPVHLVGEIVQIGAVKLDENFKVVDELRLYITPQYYTKMHKHIAALTGIRDKDLAKQGVPFPQAYARFHDWCGEEFTYMTWSMNDLPMLIDNMILHGIDITNLPDVCDIQRIFSREIMRTNTAYSLDTALSLMKEKGDTAHDALHDARNTAKICNHLELDKYLHEYTGRVFAEKPGLTRYETRKLLLQDPALLEFPCPWCGKEVKCEGWIPLNGSNAITYGSCEEGDEFYVHLGIIHHDRLACSPRRTIYELSDDLWDIYMDKKEALLGVRAS
jgi:inhibitor of KinA sporulation pathway (predicted exonuclease)